jgi:hypothetical protein
MANFIDNIPNLEAPEHSVFIEPLLNDPLFGQLPFDFIIGKILTHELYFWNRADKIGSKKVTCGWEYQKGGDYTKKPILPVKTQAAFEQCYADLLNTIHAGNLPDGVRTGELTPEIESFMVSEMIYGYNRSLLSWGLLGDTVSSNNYYTVLDGIYKKLKAGANAADGTVDVGAITASDLNATNFFATLKSIYDAQPRMLKGLAKNAKRWLWTESVYDLYTNYLYVTTQTNAGVIQRESITDGLDANTFLGIPIVVLSIVDERLEEDFVDSSGVIDPYRIILTDPTNHKILWDGGEFQNGKVWYSDDDDVVRAAASAHLVYEYGFGSLNVIAGF